MSRRLTGVQEAVRLAAGREALRAPHIATPAVRFARATLVDPAQGGARIGDFGHPPRVRPRNASPARGAAQSLRRLHPWRGIVHRPGGTRRASGHGMPYRTATHTMLFLMALAAVLVLVAALLLRGARPPGVG